MTCKTVNHYKRGQVVKLTYAITRAGVYVDPTTCTLTIYSPTGTTTTPSPTHDGTGRYHYDFTIPDLSTSVGTWKYRWQSVGGSPPADGVEEWQFQVDPPSF